MPNHAAIAVEPGLNTPVENPNKLLQFGLLVLAQGQTHRSRTNDREFVAVMLNGQADFSVAGQKFTAIGARRDVFSGPPHSLYLPAGVDFDITTTGPSSHTEIALISAPSALKVPPALITSDNTVSGTWGAANFSRSFTKILTSDAQPQIQAQRLIVGETHTPSGNWGMFPPQKHDTDEKPYESVHEAIYFTRLNPADGFGIVRHTTGGGEERHYTLQHNGLLMLPEGYHSYVIAPGYEAYTLWCMAGEDRLLIPRSEPAHAWVEKAVPMLRNV